HCTWLQVVGCSGGAGVFACPLRWAHRIFASCSLSPGPKPTVLYTGNQMGIFYSRPDLIAARAEWKQAGKTVVFTNGCYDLLHPGHVRLLESARSLGDILILALNSDASVARMKGPSRPIFSQQDRAELAAALDAVDAVVIFDEDTPRELITEVLPDILVKGADW